MCAAVPRYSSWYPGKTATPAEWRLRNPGTARRNRRICWPDTRSKDAVGSVPPCTGSLPGPSLGYTGCPQRCKGSRSSRSPPDIPGFLQSPYPEISQEAPALPHRSYQTPPAASGRWSAAPPPSAAPRWPADTPASHPDRSWGYHPPAFSEFPDPR